MIKAISALVAAAAFFVTLVARADTADCRKDAEAFATKHATTYAWVRFFVSSTGGESLPIARPCQGKSCKAAYVSTVAFPTTAVPVGFVLDPQYGTPDKLKWEGAPYVANTKCTGGLHLLVFDPTTASMAPTTPGATTANSTNDAAPSDALVFSASDNPIRDHLQIYKAIRQGGSTQKGVGSAQGLNDAVAEALQILGQIVVDRASAEAYRLLKDRLEKLLGCDPATAQAVTLSSKWPPIKFTATCRLLAPLRMQDIATSTSALLGALGKDGIAYFETLQAQSPGLKTAEAIGVGAVVASIVVPLVVRPQLLAENSHALAIVGALQAYVDPLAEKDGTFDSEAQRALAAGVLAYTRCAYESAHANPPANLAACPIATYADLYAGKNPYTETAARGLGAQLLAAATLATSNGAPDARQRVLHAVDALFASGCMLLSPAPSPASGLPYPLLRCPDPPETVDPKTLSALDVLALLQPLVDGALEGDSSVLVSSLAHVVELFASEQYEQSQKRAFLLLGSLAEYGATYAETGTNSQQLHDQRTQILESLTKDMTDRTARDGDSIWSFGGSLRAVGGARFGGANPALLGPLSLPIGIGFDHVASGSGPGIHLEFSAVDLGAYLSYDDTMTVRTPVVADAITPSFSIGAGWGKSVPLILGATASYSPTFLLNPLKDSRGSFNCGAFIGMYVPLIDLN